MTTPDVTQTLQLAQTIIGQTMGNTPDPQVVAAGIDPTFVAPLWRISKQFSFSASHELTSLPDGHQCKRNHGHNYVVVVVLESSILNGHGFVRDYGELSPIKEWIDNTVDHRFLNDVMPAHLASTAENLAYWIYETFIQEYPELKMVGVSETPKTWAWYRPEVVKLPAMKRVDGGG